MNVQAPVWVFRVFTLAAAASGALLFLRALSFLNVTWSAWRRGDRVDVAVSLMLAGTVAASVTAIAVLMFFDRYVFPIIPLLAVLCVIGVPGLVAVVMARRAGRGGGGARHLRRVRRRRHA